MTEFVQGDSDEIVVCPRRITIQAIVPAACPKSQSVPI